MFDEEVDPNTKCCLNCKAFDHRTGFCRRHPPRPIPVHFLKTQQYYMPVFPKIALPQVDWCEDGIFEFDAQY